MAASVASAPSRTMALAGRHLRTAHRSL